MAGGCGLWRGERGTALVELALVLPVLLLLVFGIWEFGRFYEAWLVVTNASREGARYAVELTDEDETTIRSLVTARVHDYIRSGYGEQRVDDEDDLNDDGGDVASYTIDVIRPSSSGAVTVTVQANVKIFLPWEQLFPSDDYPDGTFAITGRTVMRQ